jgi:TRAP-type uncharacterized transport system substrate-binding protein
MSRGRGKLVPMEAQEDRRARRDLWILVVPAGIVVAAAFAAAVHYVKPAPPRSVVIAVPRNEGGASYYARRYKAILARSGVELTVQETEGSVPALKLLAAEDTETEAAFVQGGLDVSKPEIPIESLASLAYTPLWVFYRGEPIDDPAGLRGKRVSIGPPESGTHALARTLLSANQVDQAPTELLALDLGEATQKLNAGEIDALFTVSPAESPAIKKLVATSGLQVMSFARAEAYARRYRYLKVLELPRGASDLARDLPSQNVRLLGTTSRLVVTEGIHPALSYLLLRAAKEVHESAGLFDRAGEFPMLAEGGFPPSAEARRYFTSGIPFLQRTLPFWAASLVERLWVFLLPILAVLFPVVRLIPPIYQWRVRRRIYRWYAGLKRIELELDVDAPLSLDALTRMLGQLDELEQGFRSISAPLTYSESVYAFRANIDFVRARIRKRMSDAGG